MTKLTYLSVLLLLAGYTHAAEIMCYKDANGGTQKCNKHCTLDRRNDILSYACQDEDSSTHNCGENFGKLLCTCDTPLCNSYKVNIQPPPPSPTAAPKKYKCYRSKDDRLLGGVIECDKPCVITVKDSRIYTRTCLDYQDVPDKPCTDNIDDIIKSGGCRCSTDLCNKAIGISYKCYRGAEGDCEYMTAMMGYDLLTNLPVERLCPNDEAPWGHGSQKREDYTCAKATLTLASKTCKVYGCSLSYHRTSFTSVATNDKDKDHYYEFIPAAKSNFTLIQERCRSDLCHKPDKVFKASSANSVFVNVASIVGMIIYNLV